MKGPIGIFRVAGMCLVAFSLLLASESRAKNPLVVFPEHPERLPAVLYANFSPVQCLVELGARGIPHERAGALGIIETPVTLEGTLRGVRFEFAHPTARPGNEKDVVDCRLLLALDDLARIARELDIAVVRYNSLFRRGWARKRGQGHVSGVAIDITELVQRDGTVLSVREDFAGHGIGSVTCGEGAKPAPPGKAAVLRELICRLDAARVFNLLLSPHYDRRHDDHFHFEVRRHIRWFLTQ